MVGITDTHRQFILGPVQLGSTMQNPLVFWNDVNRCDVPWVCIIAASLYLLPSQ